ncbi:MAG: TatD family hydrolase [Actinomycetes bacterium]
MPVRARRDGRAAAREGAAPPAPEPLRVAAVDSHCHLDLMDVPVDDALAAARAAGVPRVVQIGVDLPSSRWSADLAASHHDVVAAVAIHPNEAPTLAADGSLDEAMEALDGLAALPHVRAVGETGLDRYRTGPDGRQAQEESFRRHVDLAKRHGKALVIHDRDAHDDVLRVLAEEGPPETVVFHCFSGDVAMARECARRSYVMSFAGNVTFKNAQGLRNALAVAPLELLLVETDAPFLTPMPHRGRPNAPYLVPLTVRAMAEVAQVGEEDLAAAVSANATRVFGAWGS